VADTPELPQDSADPVSGAVKVTFLVPRSWRDALAEAAGSQSISMADLLRLLIRQYLRGRYTGAEQAVLAPQEDG